MRIGVVYPQTELNGDPRCLELIGRTVEELGYDHLLMYDHVVGGVHENRDPPLWEHGPYTDKHPFHEPLAAFAYLAGITDRIEFVTGVLILPQRQTVLVAKQASDVDLLSGGRLHLGVGSGWNYIEYDALGQNFSRRGERLSEQIRYLRQLWSEPLLSFDGNFDFLDRASINPRPGREIPIYCGGFNEPAFRRAAKLADGFIFASSIEKAAIPGWRRIQQLLREENRPLTSFRRFALLHDDAGRGQSVSGVIDDIRRWQDAGGSHASIVTMWRGYTSVTQHIEHLQQVREKLAQTGLEL